MKEAQNQRRALLVAKKTNSETDGGNPAKRYQEKSLKTETSQMSTHSLAFSVYLISVRRNEAQISWLKTILNWIGCLNWMRRFAGKEGEDQQESYAKFKKRKTNGLFFYTRIVEVILKKSE